MRCLTNPGGGGMVTVTILVVMLSYCEASLVFETEILRSAAAISQDNRNNTDCFYETLFLGMRFSQH
jgi:hypothetical protein